MGRPNVLLLVLDSLRARNCSVYGHSRRTTPFLEEYSTESTRYEQARSPGIHSVASHASMWTGTHVEEHGVTEHTDELRPGTSIWEELSDSGYETGLFTENTIVAESSNLSEAFDHKETTVHYVDKREKLFEDAHGPADVKEHDGIVGNLRRSIADDSLIKSLLNCGYHVYLKRRAGSREDTMSSPEIVDRFLDWEGGQDAPWAACINLLDTHYPYTPEEDFDRWGGDDLLSLHDQLSKAQSIEFVQGRPWWQLEAYESLYDGTILQADSYVERIVTALKQRGIHDDALVVVTSDHGEGFSEVSRLTGRTKMVDHSWGIHEVLTHVPLVANYPAQAESAVVEEPVSLRQFPDVVRSVLNGEGGPDSFMADGPVMASTYRMLPENDVLFEDSDEDAVDYVGPWRALYRSNDGEIRKYATQGDHAVEIEVVDAQFSRILGRDVSDVVEEVFADVERRDLKQGSGDALDEGIEDRLSDLGYLT